MHAHIKAKQRVVDHGEVFTPPHLVNAMLDMVAPETRRIESRFLEPACGTGNFLTEVLERKLRKVKSRYARGKGEYEFYAILAVSSVYGVDILKDNVEECRRRLFDVFDAAYTGLYKKKARDKCRDAARYILDLNIAHGDVLTGRTVGGRTRWFTLPEWSALGARRIVRRDFRFRDLLQVSPAATLVSDMGTAAFIPEPVKEYPPTHFLEVMHVQDAAA